MIKFERYQHINDLFQHYLDEADNKTVARLMKSGVRSSEEAEAFSEFVWRMVERINRDEEEGKVVLGSTDNTEMFPDLNYEVSKYLRSVGFYSVWERVSERHLSGSE
jgi:hypothetical protein